MSLATMTTKGRTTIPMPVRIAVGLQSADKTHSTILDDGTISLRVKNKSIRDLAIKSQRKR